MLADFGGVVECVCGVDTHRVAHQLCLVDASSGEVRCQGEVAASAAGYRSALVLARRYAPIGRVWAIEGTGSYGYGLARYLVAQGERVVEVERPKRRGRDGRLKSDQLDAHRAAKHVLSGGGSQPRLAEQTQALRLVVTTREAAVRARSEAINQLRAALLTAPPALRESLRGESWQRLVKRCQRLRSGGDDQRACFVLVARGLATRIRTLDNEAITLEQEITRRVQELNPSLLQRRGVGPITAAQLLVGWSAHGRLRNEACFARLAGVAPIPASSGQTIRHRLDPGGDRQLNRALHTIALTRARTDPQTQTFINERITRGKTRRETIRLLKRHLARSLYRHLETHTTMT
jgi:transposase